MITHDYYFCQMGGVCRNMTRYNTGKKTPILKLQTLPSSVISVYLLGTERERIA